MILLGFFGWQHKDHDGGLPVPCRQQLRRDPLHPQAQSTKTLEILSIYLGDDILIFQHLFYNTAQLTRLFIILSKTKKQTNDNHSPFLETLFLFLHN